QAAAPRDLPLAGSHASGSRTLLSPHVPVPSWLRSKCLVVLMWHGQLPQRVDGRTTQVHVATLGRHHDVLYSACPRVMHEDDLVFVDQVEVVPRDRDGGHQSPGHPANVLPSFHQRRCQAVRPPLIITQRLGDNANPSKYFALGGSSTESLAPTIEPLQVIGFTRDPLGERADLGLRAVHVPHLHMQRFGLETLEEIIELLPGKSQPSSWPKNLSIRSGISTTVSPSGMFISARAEESVTTHPWTNHEPRSVWYTVGEPLGKDSGSLPLSVIRNFPLPHPRVM